MTEETSLSFPCSRTLTSLPFRCTPGHICPGNATGRSGPGAPTRSRPRFHPSSPLRPRLCSGCESPGRRVICHPRDPPTGPPNGPEDLGCQARRNQFPAEGRARAGRRRGRNPATARAVLRGGSRRLLSRSPSASRGHRDGRCPGARRPASPDGCAAPGTPSDSDTCSLLSGQACPRFTELGFLGTETFTPTIAPRHQLLTFGFALLRNSRVIPTPTPPPHPATL